MATEDTRRAGFWLQAYAALGAPLAWFAHLLVSYALVPVACRTDSSLWLHAATILAIAVAAGAAVASMGLLRDARERTLDSEDNSSFMAYFGLIVTGVFLLAILLGGAANFIVSSCDRSL